MPNIKSAIRRVKRASNQAVVNKIRKNKYKSAIKQMFAYIDFQKMKVLYPEDRFAQIVKQKLIGTIIFL